MESIILQEHWKMRKLGTSEWLDAKVPGSVYSNLLRLGKIEDPFYRDNEWAALALCEADYEFFKTFEVEETV